MCSTKQSLCSCSGGWGSEPVSLILCSLTMENRLALFILENVAVKY